MCGRTLNSCIQPSELSFSAKRADLGRKQRRTDSRITFPARSKGRTRVAIQGTIRNAELYMTRDT